MAIDEHAMLEGRHKILLFRVLGGGEVGARLAFQTGHTFSYSREMDKIITKDGTIIKKGELETEITGIEAIQKKGDKLVKMLQESVINGQKLELWEVTIDSDKVGEADAEHPAVYAQGYLDSWELPADAEDEATISSNFQVELEPQFGTVQLTAEQTDAVQYDFKTLEAEA